MKYINQVGVKEKERKSVENDCICTSCTHLKTFYTILSFKSTKRCSIYYTKTETLHYKQCKYYNPRRKFEIIIGV